VARGLFVTGTDTGIGKTVVSAALMIRLRSLGPLRYWKPIQTGVEQDDDTATVASLAGCSPSELLTSGVRLRHPVSPHLAARLHGTVIDLPPIEDTFNEVARFSRLIVEGAGGVLVPVNDIQLMTDLMARLDLPAVIVARSTLGTINHTLLTISALREANIPLAGVVINRYPADSASVAEETNPRAIERWGKLPVLTIVPDEKFEPPTLPPGIVAAIERVNWTDVAAGRG